MTSDMGGSYDEMRGRHVAYVGEHMPEYLARLQWSRAAIDAEQTRTLRELVRHSAHRSRWHLARLRNVDVDRLTPARLTNIPPMTKNDLMENWDDIVTDPRCTLACAEAHLASLTTDAYFLDDLHVIASGGSSGTRGVFVYDWHGWAVCYLGIMRGMIAVLSRTQPPPLGTIAFVSAYAATHATSAIGQTFSDPARPTVRAPVTLPLTEIVETLNRARPSVLICYASMLPALCEEARAKRLRIGPALICSTSEPLLPEVRDAAHATWGALVLNGWATSESVGGAFSCPVASGFHIGEDVNIIEPVDGRGDPVRRGERSTRILLTNLYNRIMPLIRYEIRDEFEVAKAPCSCGSAYLKVEDVLGRADDVFTYAGNIRVHPLNFRSALGKERSIVEYQVRQTERGAEVDVTVRSDIDAGALRSELEERLGRHGLSAAEVIVRRVEKVDRQCTGKLRRFVPLPR